MPSHSLGLLGPLENHCFCRLCCSCSPLQSQQSVCFSCFSPLSLVSCGIYIRPAHPLYQLLCTSYLLGLRGGMTKELRAHTPVGDHVFSNLNFATYHLSDLKQVTQHFRPQFPHPERGMQITCTL